MAPRSCHECGKEIESSARFCRHCGAAQEVPATSTPRTPVPPRVSAESTPQAAEHHTAERIDRTASGASEFASALAFEFRSPGVVAALVSGTLAFAAVIVAGFIVAVATPGSSIIGGFDAPLVKEAMLQACALVRAPFVGSGQGVGFAANILGIDISFQTMPTLGLIIPIGAMALAVRSQLPRTEGTPSLSRLAFAVAASIPFALLMIIPGVIGEAKDEGTTLAPQVGTVFGLSLLWGAIGAPIGAGSLLTAVLDLVGPRAQQVRTFARPPLAALRALVIALALSAILVSVLVLVQTIRNEGNAVADRTKAGAAVENSLYAVEHGIHGVELGTLASFEVPGVVSAASLGDESANDSQPGLAVPVPVGKVRNLLDADGGEGSYRVFDYSDTLADYKFILFFLGMAAIPVLLALYSGFSVAREAGALRPLEAAMWGAITGPIWAIAMVVLNAIAKGTNLLSVFGHASGDSVFGWTLLIATGLGAIGGLVSLARPRVPVVADQAA